VKIAFVIGFYDPVKTALNERYPENVYRDRLVWIPSGKGSIAAFKGRFYDVAKTAEGVLVCLGRSDSERFIEGAMRNIIAVAEQQYANTPIQFRVFGNVYDSGPVIQVIESYELETQPQISSATIRARIPTGKILCMSLNGKTAILTALQRAGFSPAAIGECFEEEVRIGARNSNLMQDLEARAQAYSYLLYAWEGLRTMTPTVKKGFTYGCREARSAAQVVELFKKWITDGV
jgi:hypothetical protein